MAAGVFAFWSLTMNTEPADVLPRYIKTADACIVLGNIGRETLRQLARDGIIDPPVVLSRRVHLWDLANINRVLEQRRRVAA
jgi:hypothetical protein